MKKIFLLAVFLFSVFILYSQERKADIVVLLDTSGTMLPHYNEINERILSQLCTDFVRLEDTFHLISFSDKPTTEISQRITQVSDIQKIVSRFSLLYPLGSYSDFLNGLLYSKQYIDSLDVYTQKVLIIISDGIFNPSENSPNYALLPSDVENSIQKAIRTMSSQGVYVYYIKAPFPQNIPLKDFAGNITNSYTATEADGQEQTESLIEYASTLEKSDSVVSSDLSTNTDNDSFVGKALLLPKLSCPSDLGEKKYSFNLPLTISNISDSQILLQLDKVIINDQNVLDSTSFITIKPNSSSKLSAALTLSSSMELGEQNIEASFFFADNIRTDPQTLAFTVSLVEGKSFFKGLSNTSLIIIVIVGAIVSCLLILFLILALVRKLENSKLSEEDEQPVAINTLSSSIGAITADTVSTSKLSLPTIADRITTAEIRKNAMHESNLQLGQTNNESSITTSATNKDSATQLAAFKKEDSLSLGSQSQVASNKMLMPSLPKKPSSLSLPSLNSLKKQSSVQAASSSDKIPTKKEGTLILELFVEGQTRKIGSRNIHALKAGSRKSIGGDLSVFSIFYIRVPSNIAEIRYDGKTCSVALLKPEFFPEAESNIIEDCLNKPIKIISEHGFLSSITFTEYESETDKLNKLLLSVIPEDDKRKYI